MTDNKKDIDATANESSDSTQPMAEQTTSVDNTLVQNATEQTTPEVAIAPVAETGATPMVATETTTQTQKKGKKPKDPNAVSFGKGLGYMFSFLKPWSLQIIIACIFAVGAAMMTLLGANLLGDMGTAIQGTVIGQWNGNDLYNNIPLLSEVARIGTTLAIMYGVGFLLNYIQNWIMAGVSAEAQKRIRAKISKKINVVPIGYFDKNGYGDTLSRITNDTNTIGVAVSENFSTTIQAIGMFIGTIIAMFLTEWRLALIIIATVPISFGLLALLAKFSQKFYVKQREYLGNLNGQIEENYSGQAVVMAFRGQTKAQAKFKVTNDKLAKVSRNAEFVTGIMYPIIIFVANLGYVFMAIFGAIFLTDGIIVVGTIVSFLIYVRLFNNPMGQIAQGIGSFQGGAAGAARIQKFLDEKEQVPETVTTTIQNVKGDVEFQNVKFGYVPERTIIKDFSINVKAGQKVAIVGPTGAGKTTLVNLLMRFYELNSGTIKIDGVNINNISRQELRQMFGMVLQDTWLFEGTILENIVYNKELGDKDETYAKVKAACKAANIHHYIKTLSGGYNHQLSDDTNISSGQRQLFTIARAMVQDAPMLILDEATSNVDTRTEQIIQEAMDKLAKGRTSFVIAHRLSTIRNADIILVLRDGDIIEKGSHDELIAQNGFYCDLYNSQFSNEAE